MYTMLVLGWYCQFPLLLLVLVVVVLLFKFVLCIGVLFSLAFVAFLVWYVGNFWGDIFWEYIAGSFCLCDDSAIVSWGFVEKLLVCLNGNCVFWGYKINYLVNLSLDWYFYDSFKFRFDYWFVFTAFNFFRVSNFTSSSLVYFLYTYNIV